MTEETAIFKGLDEGARGYLIFQVTELVKDTERERRNVLRYAERLTESASDYCFAARLTPRTPDPVAQLARSHDRLADALKLIETVAWGCGNTQEEFSSWFDALVANVRAGTSPTAREEVRAA